MREARGPSSVASPPWDDWRAIEPLSPLLRSDGSGLPRQRTEVRIVLRESRLLVRFDAADRDAWSTYTKRDDPLWQEEVVEVFLAPGSDTPRRYAELEVNPGGALYDAIVDNPDSRRETLRVDAGWHCRDLVWAAGRRPDGWWAELWIPLATLLDGAPIPPDWRANFYRVDRPRDGEPEFSCWSPTLVEPPDFHKPARFGHLRMPTP